MYDPNGKVSKGDHYRRCRNDQHQQEANNRQRHHKYQTGAAPCAALGQRRKGARLRVMQLGLVTAERAR
jgi:hypothetical protein